MITADLHIHTFHSHDSTIRPATLVEQLHAHPYIKAVAITDHDTVEGLEPTRKLASVYSDILIIPGVEISTPQGDLLVLGAEEMPSNPCTIEDVVDFAKENDCVSVVAHPYREYGLGDLARNLDVDAIEILNGVSSLAANRRARELAKTMKLPGVAGTDAHNPEELWTVCTEIESSLCLDEILGALKKGSVSIASI